MRINEFNESHQLCPECGGPSFSDLVLAEKQDACYAKVKSRYKVWPSAYASGALVQCRKKGAANWGNKSEGVAEGLADTQQKIQDTINKLEDRLKHAKTPEQWDRIKDRIERLQAGLKRSQQGVAEDFNAEYDDEAGMAQGSLHTLQNAVEGLQQVIDAGDNLPEWCQEKISLAEDYLVTVWDYIQSEKAQGVDPEIEEMYEALESLAEELATKTNVDVESVWETFEALDDNKLYETAAWRRKEGKSKSGGLNAKGVASYRREHPGSKLQTAVTTKPSKLKPGSKSAKRRKSFCARMSGVKGPMKKPNGKPTRKALALRKWNC